MVKIFVRYKIYYDRARAYIGAVQFLMLAVILAKQFNLNFGFVGYCLLIILFFAGCLVVGYIDTKLGIREEEAHNYNEQNPEIMEIKNILIRIENNSSNTGKG
jgi:hypothetical protein